MNPVKAGIFGEWRWHHDAAERPRPPSEDEGVLFFLDKERNYE
jgi:hypothetical protein